VFTNEVGPPTATGDATSELAAQQAAEAWYLVALWVGFFSR